MYYSADWQLLEERVDQDFVASPGVDRHQQYAWGHRYIDDAILHRIDDDGPGPGGYDRTYYHLTDVQFSTRAIVDAAANLVERVSYTAYGEARHHRMADLIGDGDVGIVDDLALLGNWGNYGVGDLDRDGTVGIVDFLAERADWGVALQPRGLISASSVDNQIGYDGYVFNAETQQYHVRHRCYDPILGRWLQRDPSVYIDGMNTYQYVESRPITSKDPSGLVAIPCSGRKPTLRDALCCRSVFSRGAGTALTICCKGNLVACVDDKGIKRRSKGKTPKAIDAVIACLKKCEPLHCPNFNCKPGSSGNPQPKTATGPGSFDCSECAVHTCYVDCARGKHAASDAGRKLLHRTIKEAEKKRKKFCDKCAEDQDPAHDPGCNPGDPIGVPIR